MTLRRQSWLLTLATYVMLALTAVVVALSLLSAMQALGVHSWRADEWWTILLPPDSGDVGFLITFAGVIQASIFYLRRKAAWRVKALEGSADVMPLALPKLVVGEDGEPVEAKPATLQWRLTGYGRRMWLLLGGIEGLLFIGVGALFLWLSVALINTMSPQDSIIHAMFDLAGAVCVLSGLAFLAFGLVKGFHGPDGVSADSAGISRWTQRGPGETVLWSDVRLLEVSWIGANRETAWPYIRVYRADGASIGWPVFPAPQPGVEWRYEPLEMTESEAAEASRALLRLASASSGLPVRTAERSLADPTHKWGQWLLGAVQSLAGYLWMVLTMVALGLAILVYHGVGDPWLNIAASVGLTLCALRLAYFYARDALVIPDSWETRDGARPGGTLMWPALLAVSGAGALVASISALVAGHAPASGWTDTEVIGGSVLMFLSGALIFWARTGASERASATSMRA